MDQAQMKGKPNKKYSFENEEFYLDRYLEELRNEVKRDQQQLVPVPEPAVEKLVTPETQDKPSVTPVAVPMSAPAAEKLAVAPKPQNKSSVKPGVVPRSAPAAEKLAVAPRTLDKSSVTPMVVPRSAPAIEKLAVVLKTQDKSSVTPVVVPISAPAAEKLAIAPNVQDNPKAQDDIQDKMLQQRTSVSELSHEKNLEGEKSSTTTVKVDDGAHFAEPGASATTHQAPNELARENIVREQPLSYGGNDAGQIAKTDNEDQSSSRAGGNPRWNNGSPRELDSRFKNHGNKEFQSRRWRKNDNFAHDGHESPEEVIVSYGPTRIPRYMPTIEIVSISITQLKK